MSKNTFIPISITKSLCLIISHTFLRYTVCLPVAICSSDLSPSNHLGQRHVCVLHNRICSMHEPQQNLCSNSDNFTYSMPITDHILYVVYVCFVRSFLYFDGRHEIISFKPNSALNSNPIGPNPPKKNKMPMFSPPPKI